MRSLAIRSLVGVCRNVFDIFEIVAKVLKCIKLTYHMIDSPFVQWLEAGIGIHVGCQDLDCFLDRTGLATLHQPYPLTIR